MKLPIALALALLVAAGSLAGCSKSAPAVTTAAPSGMSGELLPVSATTDAAWLAKAQADYPLKTCVVSKDDLGGMGPTQDFIYKVAGQPDRLVRFCCKDCVADFKKDANALMASLGKAPAGTPAAPAMKH